MKQRITRREIADRAGVSLSVVSRTLHGSGYVSPEKREAVLAAARTLGYLAQPVRNLSAARSREILYYCEDLRNPFHIHVYQGMQAAAADSGYMILANGTMQFDHLDRYPIDGVVLPNEEMARQYLTAVGTPKQLPAVCAGYNDPRKLPRPLPLVEVDLYAAVLTALNYLWDRGHRRVAYGVPERLSRDQARSYAYRTWVLEHGLYTPDRYLIPVEDPAGTQDYFELGRLCAVRVTREHPEVTALLCFNDEFALGARKELAALDRRVPEDLSLVGIDGIYSRRYASPLLTTVNIQPELQGRECFLLMWKLLTGERHSSVTRIPFFLEEGGSVATIK